MSRRQRHRIDDRRRPGSRPGPRPVRASGRRTGRAKPERDRHHCSSMANRVGDLTWRTANHKHQRYRQRHRHAGEPSEHSPERRSAERPERAAILMLALGEQYGGKVWALLDDDEVRELSMVMSTLGTVEADVVGRPAARICVADVGIRRADGNFRRAPNGCCSYICPPIA